MKGFEVSVSDYGNILTLRIETAPDTWMAHNIRARDTADQTADLLESAAAMIRSFNHLPASPSGLDSIFKGR